jgi:hypothetical protein
MRYQTFISYSHADQEWYKRLLVHLRPLRASERTDGAVE